MSPEVCHAHEHFKDCNTAKHVCCNPGTMIKCQCTAHPGFSCYSSAEVNSLTAQEVEAEYFPLSGVESLADLVLRVVKWQL